MPIRCRRAPWLTTERGAGCGGAERPWVTDAEGSTVKEWHGRGHDGRGVEGVLPAEKASTTAAWCGREVRSSVEQKGGAQAEAVVRGSCS